MVRVTASTSRGSGREIIVLLRGGDKSTQANDINAAKLLAKKWEDFDG